MTDRGHAPVDRHEPAAPDPRGDAAVAEPEVAQLGARHHAVLPVGERRERPLEGY